MDVPGDDPPHFYRQTDKNLKRLPKNRRGLMDSFQTLILLIFFATILVGVAQKMRTPYPIVLVVAGTAIGFIPWLKPISFDPNLILLILLPPILYYAAFAISFREFKRHWHEIFSLALGLVILTTLIIGIIFKWLFPQWPWALAFAFGAIVSPPDSVAATNIMRRFAIKPRLLAIVEGESLVNDASALVLYKMAVAALLSGTFSLSGGSIEFVKVVLGGILVGLILGWIIQNLSKKYLEPIVAILVSFTIPYITYLIADRLGFSGVLAVVVNGLIGSHLLAKHPSSLRRILGFTFWDIFNIALNCCVFMLIGLELKEIVFLMAPRQILLYSLYGLFLTVALIVIRLAWVYARTSFTYMKARSLPQKDTACPEILRGAAIIGWSGMRGIVSLTAALALPYIEGRNAVIFMTYVIILLTLLLPSTTLAYLIRLMKIEYHEEHRNVHQARKRLAKIAEEKIHHLHETGNITDKEYDFLNRYFNMQRFIFEISSSHLKKLSSLESARLQVFKAQRQELFALWEKQEIDDRLFRQLEHELDVEESHIARAELK
jgi:Na+/H+ antiporter